MDLRHGSSNLRFASFQLITLEFLLFIMKDIKIEQIRSSTPHFPSVGCFLQITLTREESGRSPSTLMALVLLRSRIKISFASLSL
jgi:hypothetical protein